MTPPVIGGALRRLDPPPVTIRKVRLRDFGEAVTDSGPHAGRSVRKTLRLDPLDA